MPTQIVPCKLVSELYSKFTPIQQSTELTWDFEENFQNTYARFLTGDRENIPIIPQLNVLNKNALLRANRS